MDNRDIAKFVTKNRSQYLKNPILVQHETGKVRKTCYDLPPEEFVYGKKNLKDKEGTREVVLSWKTAKLSPDKLARKDFIKMNKKSLKQGIVDNKTLKTFRKKNDIRVKRKNKTVQKLKLPSDSDDKHIYGIKSVKMSNAKDLIMNMYESDWKAKKESEFKKKKRRIVREKNRRKQMERKNLYSKRKLHQQKHEKAQEKPLFKMKKFQNVKSRLRTQGGTKMRNSHEKYGLDILRK